MCLCAKLLLSCLLFATLWTVARHAPLSMGILQARILEWVARILIPLLQGIFPTQGSNPCLLWLPHCRQILCCRATGEAPR